MNGYIRLGVIADNAYYRAAARIPTNLCAYLRLMDAAEVRITSEL
jgi:hypothetical protein